MSDDSRRTPRWRRYLRLVRPNLPEDVDDELAFHLDMRTERNLVLGMSPEDARREAEQRFGDVAPVRASLVEHDVHQHARTERAELFSDLIHDVRFGTRSLLRAPGFTLAAALTLALGIGANAAIFSVVEALVLRPLPYARPHELVSLGSGSAGEYLALRERLRTVQQLAAWVEQTHPVDDGHEAVRAEGAAVTTNLMGMLGAGPMMGRAFTEQDAVIGNNTVVIISHGMWLRRFGGAADVVGRRLNIEGMPYTIVGVMPSSFNFPNKNTDYWQPYAFDLRNAGVIWAVGGKKFIGRLAAGATVEQARREVRTVWPSLRRMNPLWDPGDSYRRDAAVTPLQDNIVGSTRPLVLMLFGSVLLVLGIACVNVANLLLARATARERELAVRAALGGGRARLIRQLMTVRVLLALCGAVLGIGVGAVAIRALVAALPAGVPRADEVALNLPVLAYAALLSVGTGLLFGIVPAWRATSSRTSVGSVVGFGRRATAGPAHAGTSAALVAGEVALAVMLAVSSILLVRSFIALRSTATGFNPENLIAARITPPVVAFLEPARLTAFYSTILDRARALPGVRDAAAVDKLPMAQPVWGVALRIEHQFEDGKRVLPDIGHWQSVTPAYFGTMGIPLLRGRAFTDGDRSDAAPVAIVSQSLAHRFWPDEDAIGKRVGYPYESPWMTIVGIVPDTKQDSLRDTLSTSIYTPWGQRSRMSGAEMWLVVRSAGDPASVTAAIRRIVTETDRTVPVSDVRTMSAVLDRSLSTTRFTMTLVAAFAALALILGAVGIYGVMSYLVSQRTREMGIRVALGATRSGVVRLVVGRAVRLAAAGSIAGLVAALFTTRALRQWLYGVSSADPATLAIVAVLFLGVAALASAAPALRATRVDPSTSLRAE
jgi:putative ABC transport system permease protein